MKSLLLVEKLLENRKNYFIVDVRSPGEYRQASIPGAVNVPLFDDEERAVVGTVYWQEGAERAKRVGLSFVAAKLPRLVDEILDRAAGREIALYCWRGGMRSRVLAACLEALGYPVWQLVGGYKAFRREVVRFLGSAQLNVPVFVLNGLTGVGKTQVIRRLASLGAPALDLEEMAGHRGSVFGSIGFGPPRSQKDFEARLFLGLLENKNAPCLIVEGEGRRIGPVLLPDFLLGAMQRGPHILLEAKLETRVERILDEYRGEDSHAEELAAAVFSLQKRLGQEKCARLAEQILSGDYKAAAMALCTGYYDLYYGDSRRGPDSYLAVVDVTDLDLGAQKILDIIARFLKGAGAE